jgi:hypothetical protein
MTWIAYFTAFLLIASVVCAEEPAYVKDRRVFDKPQMYLTDPEVLISGKKPEPPPVVFVAPQESAKIEYTAQEPVSVTAQLCDENSCMDMESTVK